MATKLLLIKDVNHLGRSGDLVSVKPGYARNMLLPGEYARIATPHTLRMQAQLQEERRQQAIADQEESQRLAESLSGLMVTTTVKVDPSGHMYGSVNSSDIVQLLNGQHHIALDKRSIQLAHPIKEVGVNEIAVRFKEGVSTTFILKIIAEGSSDEELSKK